MAKTNETSVALRDSTKKQKTQPDFASWAQAVLQANEEASASKPLTPTCGLYIVATPIGNMGDITLRALWVLSHVDAVLCEDTRVTGGLLHHYGIKRPLVSCHDHNEEARVTDVLARLHEGQTLALVSDAGTPLISDPGYRLVRACRREGYPVFALPGASALLTSLASAGLPTDQFTFVGFLPAKASARRKALEALQHGTGTMVFYESTQRIAATLASMRDVWGEEREVCTARELTKLHEEFQSGTIGELADFYAATDTPKGELVLLVAGATEGTGTPAREEIEALLHKALETMSLRDAVTEVTRQTGLKKSAIYQIALTIAARN